MNNIGTFQHCTNCSSKKCCCSQFDVIDAPILNKEELLIVKNFIKNEGFYEILEKNLFSLKLIGDDCVFYKDGKCIIYHIRPVDCKLYPFDIIKINADYYLILYLLDCINYEDFYHDNLNIDSLINDVIPWINEFTDERNFTKMKNKQYKIIKKINR